jgi:hypothetical protein
MIRPIALLSVLVPMLLGACAASTSRTAAADPRSAGCGGSPAAANARCYSQEDLRRTGETDPARALSLLDPSISAPR